MAIINGRRVTNIPDAGAYGSEIIKEMKVGPGRRPVFVRDSGSGNEKIDPRKIYTKRDVLDRKGRPFKVSDIPDRTKGSLAADFVDEAPFQGVRGRLSKTIIWEQVISIQENRFKSEDAILFDEDHADWVMIRRYPLPAIWRHVAISTDLLIVFPTHFPEVPPIGCYMQENIPQSPNGHFYKAAYHDASKRPLVEANGWKWYCVYVAPGTWRPAPVRKPGDWQNGDNLWTYIDLINEALASTD